MIPATKKPAPLAVPTRSLAIRRAGWSLLLPGLGQWLQGRPVAAALQFSTVILAALDASTPTLIAIAVVARVLSGLEAFQHEPLPTMTVPGEKSE